MAHHLPIANPGSWRTRPSQKRSIQPQRRTMIDGRQRGKDEEVQPWKWNAAKTLSKRVNINHDHQITPKTRKSKSQDPHPLWHWLDMSTKTMLGVGTSFCGTRSPNRCWPQASRRIANVLDTASNISRSTVTIPQLKSQKSAPTLGLHRWILVRVAQRYLVHGGYGTQLRASPTQTVVHHLQTQLAFRSKYRGKSCDSGNQINATPSKVSPRLSVSAIWTS